MFELIRKTEGEISQKEFSKTVMFLFVLTAGAALVLYLFERVNSSMVWMTTAVAPFLGLLIAFVVFSILYFWTNVFLKRYRTIGRSPIYIYIWLALFFATSIIRLVAYQFTSLSIPDAGFVVLASGLMFAMQLGFLILFTLIIFIGLKPHGAEKV